MFLKEKCAKYSTIVKPDWLACRRTGVWLACTKAVLTNWAGILTQPYGKHIQGAEMLTFLHKNTQELTLKGDSEPAWFKQRGSCGEWVGATAITWILAANPLLIWITVNTMWPLLDMCRYQWPRSEQMTKPAQYDIMNKHGGNLWPAISKFR